MGTLNRQYYLNLSDMPRDTSFELLLGRLRGIARELGYDQLTTLSSYGHVDNGGVSFFNPSGHVGGVSTSSRGQNRVVIHFDGWDEGVMIMESIVKKSLETGLIREK